MNGLELMELSIMTQMNLVFSYGFEIEFSLLLAFKAFH